MRNSVFFVFLYESVVAGNFKAAVIWAHFVHQIVSSGAKNFLCVCLSRSRFIGAPQKRDRKEELPLWDIILLFGPQVTFSGETQRSKFLFDDNCTRTPSSENALFKKRNEPKS